MKNRYKIIIAGLVLVLVMSAGIGSAWAYFTTFDEAAGNIQISIEPPRIDEEYTEGAKHVVITNNPDSSVYVWVRARAFVGEEYKKYVGTPSGEGWSNEGDWSYYGTPLAPGAKTGTLDITVTGIPVTPESKGETVNVAVVYECIPAAFDEEGNPIAATAADWEKEAE